MSRQLSMEFAKSVELPLNPVKRHERIAQLLGDQAIVGSDFYVDLNKLTVGGDIFGAEMTIYGSGSIRPFKHILGRGTLKRVAWFTDYVEQRNKQREQIGQHADELVAGAERFADFDPATITSKADLRQLAELRDFADMVDENKDLLEKGKTPALIEMEELIQATTPPDEGAGKHREQI